MNDQVETIKKLLDQIFLFDYDFKKNVILKVEKGIDDGKIKELIDLLNHCMSTQEKIFDELIKKDPEIAKYLLVQKKRIENEILEAYSNVKAKQDSEKMQKIQSIINSI